MSLDTKLTVRAGTSLEGTKVRLAGMLSALGDHDIEVLSLDDPESRAVAVGIRCRICGSGLKGAVPFAARQAPEGLNGVTALWLERPGSWRSFVMLWSHDSITSSITYCWH